MYLEQAESVKYIYLHSKKGGVDTTRYTKDASQLVLYTRISTVVCIGYQPMYTPGSPCHHPPVELQSLPIDVYGTGLYIYIDIELGPPPSSLIMMMIGSASMKAGDGGHAYSTCMMTHKRLLAIKHSLEGQNMDAHTHRSETLLI